MLFRKDLIKSNKKELEINDELTENDFLKINKEISRALFQMKKEKNFKEDTSDDDEEKEINNINNNYNIKFFSSNNISTVSIYNFSNNSEKSFKNVDIELNNNNNINNINNNINLKNNFENKIYGCGINFNSIDFYCKYDNINNINNSSISNFPLNKNLCGVEKCEINSKINEFNKLENCNSLNSNKNEQKISEEMLLNTLNIDNCKNNDNMNVSSFNKNNKNINQGNINNFNLEVFNKNINQVNIKNLNQLNCNDVINNNINNNFLNNIFVISNNYITNNINKIPFNQNQNLNILNNLNQILFNNTINSDITNKNNTDLSLSPFSERKNNNNKDSPKNIIHIKNIIKGNDKRTTLIIRNIPNKYTISLLLNEFKNKFNYKFDVLFLPQDYYNNSNLGYGFINFINYKHLIHFYDEYQGKKWPTFNSNKICQLAYSKYQGKSELMKYIHKKLSITCHFNNDENLKKSFYINTDGNYNKPLIEIPLKYFNTFKSYNLGIVYQFQNDKIFIKENMNT